MFTLNGTVNAVGDKKTIFQIKEELLRILSQCNCECMFTLADKQGFQETVSATFRPVIEVSTDEIIDLTLTGDEKYELLVQKEKEDEASATPATES